MIGVDNKLVLERGQLVLALLRPHEVGDATPDIPRGRPEHQNHKHHHVEEHDRQEGPFKQLQLTDAPLRLKLVLCDDVIHADDEAGLGAQHLLHIGRSQGVQRPGRREQDRRLALDDG